MADPYPAQRKRAEQALRAAKDALEREIAEYPRPVAGCDAQYTHLLEERRRLAAALDALGAPVFVPTPRALEPAGGGEG